MKRIGIFMVYIFCLTGFRPLEAKEYNILDFGAVSDTGKLSTQAVQQAIDACHAAGGGMVLVPAGHFKIGSIVLRSYVDLHLESGAVLLGSKKLEDYIKLKPAYTSLRTQEATIQLIYAENAEQISITGLGEIDGQGSGFKKLDWNDEGITRPHLLRFITCTRVKIENISMKNAGCWMQHYLACENVQIRNIRVFNRNNYNNDALDLDGCRNVTVSGLIADSDDDGITLKSTSPKPCENISISNCVVSSRCNAIKMGTESNGGFRNISISNCVVKPSKAEAPGFFGQDGGTSAISLEIVDGGIMEGISISNIQVEGTEAPIFIRLGNRARSWKKDLPVDHVGELADVSISHVRVIRAGKTACSITGQPGYPVRNIRLSHIVVQSEGTGTAADFNREVAYLPRDY
ncbi:MAG: glycoside hydrolase family 28 protein, partial [Mangrovibacterium sp.]